MPKQNFLKTAYVDPLCTARQQAGRGGVPCVWSFGWGGGRTCATSGVHHSAFKRYNYTQNVVIKLLNNLSSIRKVCKLSILVNLLRDKPNKAPENCGDMNMYHETQNPSYSITIPGFFFARKPPKSTRPKCRGNEFWPFGNEFWCFGNEFWCLGNEFWRYWSVFLCFGNQLWLLMEKCIENSPFHYLWSMFPALYWENMAKKP